MALALLSTKYINQDRYPGTIKILGYTEAFASTLFLMSSVVALNPAVIGLHPSNELKNRLFPWSRETYVVMSVVGAIFYSMSAYCLLVLGHHDDKRKMVQELKEIRVGNMQIEESLHCVSLSERIQAAVEKSK